MLTARSSTPCAVAQAAASALDASGLAVTEGVTEGAGGEGFAAGAAAPVISHATDTFSASAIFSALFPLISWDLPFLMREKIPFGNPKRRSSARNVGRWLLGPSGGSAFQASRTRSLRLPRVFDGFMAGVCAGFSRFANDKPLVQKGLTIASRTCNVRCSEAMGQRDAGIGDRDNVYRLPRRCRCEQPRPAIHEGIRYCVRCDGDLPVIVGPASDEWRTELFRHDRWSPLAVGLEAVARAAAVAASALLREGNAVRVVDPLGSVRWWAGAPVAMGGNAKC